MLSVSFLFYLKPFPFPSPVCLFSSVTNKWSRCLLQFEEGRQWKVLKVLHDTCSPCTLHLHLDQSPAEGFMLPVSLPYSLCSHICTNDNSMTDPTTAHLISLHHCQQAFQLSVCYQILTERNRFYVVHVSSFFIESTCLPDFKSHVIHKLSRYSY